MSPKPQHQWDLETGTYLTRDPAGFVDGPNLYAYVRQNPWTSVDPEGLIANFVIQAAVGAVVGGGLEIATQMLTTGTVSDWGSVGKSAAVGAVAGATGAGAVALLSKAKNLGTLGKAAKKTYEAFEKIDEAQSNVEAVIETGTKLAEGDFVGAAVAATDLSGGGKGKAGKSDPGGPSAKTETGCFLAGTDVMTHQFGHRAIESIQVGERVATDSAEKQESTTEVDRENWRRFDLCVPSRHQPGTNYDISLLRPKDWAEQMKRDAQGRVWLEIDELDLGEWAEIQSITECPPIEEEPGRVVLMTITHVNGTLLRLSLGSRAPGPGIVLKAG